MVAANTDNTIEENEIVGNANGIFMTAGVQGNTIRRNTIVGNPPVQAAVDHTANSGFDIKNLADVGANTFEGNICMTSVNAPCPSVGPSLTANPNPIPVAGNGIFGATTLNWNAPDARDVEIHIGNPSGPLFVGEGSRGSAQTGLWVVEGMTFYLQDVTDGKPLTSDYTLATLVVHLQRSGTAGLHLPGKPHTWAFGASAMLLCLALCGIAPVQYASRRKRVRIALRGAALLAVVGLSFSQGTALAQTSQTVPSSASSPAAAKQTADKLDQMIAAGASSKQLAQYVFDTHGCKNCHTMGHDGKLGFTAKGKEKAQGFEGCIKMLTAMTVIVQVPEDKRSPQQRQKAERFQEFGCVACHRLTPGKLGLTEVGAKLAHLHLGCVDVEKLTSGGTSSQTDIRR